MKAQYIKIDEDGHKFYYSDHEMRIRHREDGPACEYADGTKAWYWHGTEIDQLTHLVLRYQSSLPLDNISSDAITYS